MSRRSQILDRVIGHLYYQAQRAQCRREHELWTITLRLVSLAKKDVPSLDQAAYMTCGRNFEGWRKGTQEREAMVAREFAALIPDYDPTLDERRAVRRPEPFTGNLYAFEGARKKEPTIEKPLREVSGGAARKDAG